MILSISTVTMEQVGSLTLLLLLSLQSIESIIFSAILISLTAKTIHSRSSMLKEESQVRFGTRRCRGVLISEGGMYRLQWSWDLKIRPY